MDQISFTLAELSALLEITAELAERPVSPNCLIDIFSSLWQLIPFARCILLHERDPLEDGNARLTEFTANSIGKVERLPTSSEKQGVRRYLAEKGCQPAFKNAFHWKPDTTCPQWMNSHGIGASIAYQSRKGEGGTTALLLQCDKRSYIDRHLAMMDLVICHLHLSLLNQPALATDNPQLASLTKKEAEVIEWASKGKTSWEIGKILAISERTVKFHLANIYTKFNVTNRVQAVSIASGGQSRESSANKFMNFSHAPRVDMGEKTFAP